MPILECQNGAVTYQPPAPQWWYPVAEGLPPIIGNAVNEVSTNLGVPIALTAQSALAVVSLVCQNYVNVQCPGFSPGSCGLFLWGVNNSSAGKSEVNKRFLRAVQAFERKQREQVAALMPNFIAELKVWKDDECRLAEDYRKATQDIEIAQAIKNARLQHEMKKPQEPVARQLRYAELSPQGLRDLLAANGAIGIVSAEAGPVVNGMTFRQPALLSGYWSGEDHPVGLTERSCCPVEPRLTISVMLQAEQFSTFMKNRADDAFGAGLWGRFLVASPVSSDWPGKQTIIADIAEPNLDLFNGRATKVLNQPVPDPYQRAVLQLSERAKYFWKLYKEFVHNELICGQFSENIKSFFRKLGEQVARIAALFHYFDGQLGDISPEAMKRAIVLCEWYTSEFIRIFTPFAPSPLQKGHERAQKLLEWLQDAAASSRQYPKLTPGRYTERDLANYSPIRGNPAELANAIDTLHRQGDISIMYGPKNGRIIFYPPTMPYMPSMPSMQQQPYQMFGPRSLFDQLLNSPQNTGALYIDSGVPLRQDSSCTNQNMQMGSAPVQSHDPEQIELDGALFDDVIREIQKMAFDAGIGPVKVSASYNRN